MEKDASEDKYSTFGLEKELERETKLKSEVALISPPFESKYILSDVYLPKKKTTDSIANLCLFQCTKCKFTTKKWGIFERHKRCGVSFKFHSSCVLEARYYRCKVCPLKMLCDTGIIKNTTVGFTKYLLTNLRASCHPAKLTLCLTIMII